MYVGMSVRCTMMTGVHQAQVCVCTVCTTTDDDDVRCTMMDVGAVGATARVRLVCRVSVRATVRYRRAPMSGASGDDR